jgi:hypothetical protein
MKRLWVIMCFGLLLFGCSKSEESLAKKAGDKVGEALTDFASGMGKGIDKKMNVQVELSDSLVNKGISSTASKLDAIVKKNLSVYFIATKPYTGKLTAKAFNEQGKEIGRASVDTEFGANDAKYVIFTFHEEMDTQLVAKYTIEAQ